MNLYRLLYEGASKQAPARQPKHALSRFARILWGEGFTLVKLNLLFLCACLPVLTIGPALCALASVSGRLARDEPVLLWQDYWAAFRQSFRRGFWSGLALAACCAGLAAAGAAAVLRLPESVWRYAAASAVCAVWLLVCGAAVYLFSLYGENAPHAWKTAWLLSLAFPQRALPCALGVTGAALFAVLFLPYSVPLVLLILNAGVSLAVRCVLEKDLRRAAKAGRAKFPSFD